MIQLIDPAPETHLCVHRDDMPYEIAGMSWFERRRAALAEMLVRAARSVHPPQFTRVTVVVGTRHTQLLIDRRKPHTLNTVDTAQGPMIAVDATKGFH